MNTNKKQRDKICNSNVGYGWIVWKSGEKEISEIEIYVGRDRVLRRVGDGKPLLPIEMVDPEDGIVSIDKAN